MGKRRKKRKAFYSRKGRRNHHHILAKERGGLTYPANIILLDENRHAAFHLLFSNRTLREASEVLLRMAIIKESSLKEEL